MGEEYIKVAALGRKFKLGQLYDYSTDNIVENGRLWSDDVLKDVVKKEAKVHIHHKALRDSGMASRCAAFDMSNNLKLSFYSGFVGVRGASTFINSPEGPKESSRFAFACTKIISSKMVDVHKIPKEKNNDIKEGSHVVVKIQYGWQGLFVFQKYGEYPVQVQDQILAAISSIPEWQPNKKGNVHLPPYIFHDTIDMKCCFYGDVQTPFEPKSFLDAVKVYNRIISDKHLTDKEEIPVTVWLKPVGRSDSKTLLCKEIQSCLVTDIETFLQEIETSCQTCSALKREDSVTKLEFLRNIITEGLQLIEDHSEEFRTNLARLLLRVREGDADEKDIQQLLPSQDSPFAPNSLKVWIYEKQNLICAFNQVTSTLPSFPLFERKGDFDRFLSKQDKRQEIVSFLIKTESTDAILDGMKSLSRNLTGKNVKQVKDSNHSTTNDINRSQLNTLVEKFQTFSVFAKTNQGRQSTSFVVTIDSKGIRNTHGVVQVFQEGQVKIADMRLPSKPLSPEACDMKFDQITLKFNVGKLNPSETYEVQCKPLRGNFDQPLQVPQGSDCYKLTKLKPNMGYTFRVRVKSLVGNSLWSDEIRRPVFTLAACKPGKPTMKQTSIVSGIAEWLPPSVTAENVCIEGYQINCFDLENDRVRHVHASDLSAEVSELLPNVTYKFSVTALCTNKSVSETSDESDEFILTASNPMDILKAQLITESEILTKGQPSIYQLNLKERIVQKSSMMRKCELGRPKPGMKEKIIMVVGATGAGKTTLINGMINYIVGVKWDDRFRFKFIDEGEGSKDQSCSQTQWITQYTLHHREEFEIPYTLSIIDTPGFGDTQGVKRDKQITEQIRKFFSTRGPDGIDHIDAIGFVAQASLPRLTPTQKFIFDSILSLFGKDIGGNIFLLVTFADGQKPPLLAGIKAAKLPYQKHFKFNNSALFAANESSRCAIPNALYDEEASDDEDGSALFDKMFWEMGEKSFQTFFKSMNKTEEQSLLLTKDVLEERNKVETNVAGIQQQIQAGLNTLEQLREELNVLKQHRADIDKNKDFTYTVTEDTVKQVDIPSGTYVTNCLQCNFTCHYPCKLPDDDQKIRCLAMSDGKCRICNKKCIWNVHKNMPYRLVITSEKKVKTSTDLKERYEEALGKQTTAEKLIGKVWEDFEGVQMQVVYLTNEVRKSLDHLKEIALKPDPLTTVEYIDTLIESEQMQKHPGFKGRVAQLREVRLRAETMDKLSRSGFDPFEEYKHIYIEVQQEGNGLWGVIRSAGKRMKDFIASAI